ELYLGCRVTALVLRDRLVEINGRYQVPYGRLVSTLPLPVLVRLMGDEAPSRVRAAAAALRWTSVINVNLGLDRPGDPTRHWVYFPERRFVFYRVGFPSAVEGAGMAPRGRSSLNAEVSVRA